MKFFFKYIVYNSYPLNKLNQMSVIGKGQNTNLQYGPDGPESHNGVADN